MGSGRLSSRVSHGHPPPRSVCGSQYPPQAPRDHPGAARVPDPPRATPPHPRTPKPGGVGYREVREQVPRRSQMGYCLGPLPNMAEMGSRGWLRRGWVRSEPPGPAVAVGFLPTSSASAGSCVVPSPGEGREGSAPSEAQRRAWGGAGVGGRGWGGVWGGQSCHLTTFTLAVHDDARVVISGLKISGLPRLPFGPCQFLDPGHCQVPVHLGGKYGARPRVSLWKVNRLPPRGSQAPPQCSPVSPPLWVYLCEGPKAETSSSEDF